VTIELVRRLLAGGAPAAAVEQALIAEASQGVPFVAALTERFPELAQMAERELERAEAPEIHWVRPVPELVRRVPAGMCERLLAVPVHEDANDGRVDVAAVDVLGPHVGVEFAFHLAAPVRVLRARLPEIRAALASLAVPVGRASGDSRGSVRAPPDVSYSGTQGSVPPPRLPSDAPIPLVRRPPFSQRSAGTAPSEPVLNLSRSKVFSPEPPFAFELSFEAATAELARADSAEQVARVLCQALEPAVVLVVAVRGGSLEVRAASRSVADKATSSFSLPAGKNSVFDIAVRAGFYLGPLPSTWVHAELRGLLPSGAADEVYSAPVLVASRPVLALMMARFGPSLDATRRADRLIVAAAAAIERILRSKKRGG
jgi:hypothetical protein